jgi:Uncharacterized protein conserved in bacteria
MKKLKILTLLTCLIININAYAQSAAEKEAEILLDSLGMEDLMSRSMSQLIDVQLQQNPDLAPYKNVMIEFFDKHLSWDSIKPAILKIYSEEFTASELQEINRFYSTEVGKKTLEKMPALMAQGAQIGMTRVQANMAELQSMIQAESERLEELEQE